MKKKGITLAVSGAILVILAGMLIVVKKTDIFKEEEVEEEVYNLVFAEKDDVCKISYLVEEETVTLEKDGENWIVSGMSDKKLDNTKVENVISSAVNVSTSTVIDSPDNLAEYGLDDPSNTISLTLNDGSVEKYYIGDKEEINGGYFATNGDGKVYVIAASYVNNVAKSVDDLLEKEASEDSAGN